MKNRIALLAVCLALSAGVLRAADIDSVYRRGETKPVAGQLTSVSKAEVVVTQKVGNKEEHIPANEIARVEFQGEPPMLGLARSNEGAGNINEALAGLQEALGAAGDNTNLKGEIEFLIARTLAKQAQADRSKAAAAMEKLNGFLNAYRDHYRFFPAQLLLAETALGADEYPAADSAFDRVQQAPWPEYQMAGKNGAAQVLLAQKKVADAKALFEQVAGMKAATPAERGRQLEAMLGQAECLQRSNQSEQAAQALQKVIDQTAPENTRLLAQAYLQLGNVYSTDGQHAKEALLAYLHVDVIPELAENDDLHAEALFNLSKLWPAIGQPARGAEASAKLQQDYPASEWTKKLSEGS